MSLEKALDAYVLSPKPLTLSKEFKHDIAKKMAAKREIDRSFSQFGCMTHLDIAIHERLDRPVVHSDRSPFTIYPDIVWDAYGENSDETSRWNGLMMSVYSKRLPLKSSPESMLLRLRLWELFFLIDGDPADLATSN